MSICVLAIVAVTLAVGCVTPAWSDFELTMPVNAATTSADIYDLHLLILWCCVGIAVLVYSAMIYTIVRFQAPSSANSGKFTHNRVTEVIWTLLPAAIVIGLSIPAAATLERVRDTGELELTIRVTGDESQWHYDYVDSVVAQAPHAVGRWARGLSSERAVLPAAEPLATAGHPVVVPVGAKVQLLVTATGEPQTWWVPDFGVEKDAVEKDALGGYIDESWFLARREGTFSGQCAEPCSGVPSSRPIVVHVVSASEYQYWLAGRQAPN